MRESTFGHIQEPRSLRGSLKGSLKQSISNLKMKKSVIYGVLYNTLKDAFGELSPEERGCLTTELTKELKKGLGDKIFDGKTITMDLVFEDPFVKK